MTTPFERVKAAWESPDREGELNRVVETMAAEGVFAQRRCAREIALMRFVWLA